MAPSLITPSLLLGLLMSVAYAALFHLWWGRSTRQLLLLILAAAVGFGVGQFVGTLVRIPALQIGEVHMIEATVGAWLALAVAYMATSPLPRRTRG
ncbi:MAG: hypothetical protein ACRC1H_15755 [Caldilineaceae bacterium]